MEQGKMGFEGVSKRHDKSGDDGFQVETKQSKQKKEEVGSHDREAWYHLETEVYRGDL